MRFRLELAADSSMESVFAGYQKELFDRYHLLFLWESPEEIKREMENFLSYYFNPSKETILSGGNFFSMELENIDILKIITATDEGGSIFEQEAVDSLGYTGIMSQVDRLLGHWNVLKEGEITYEEIHGKDEEVKNLLGDGTALLEEAGLKEISAGNIEKFSNILGNITWGAMDIFEESVSDKSIELTGLPTKEIIRYNQDNGDLIKSCAFSIYIQKYFSCYTSQKVTYSEENGLKYEQEYILNGFSKDIDNLKATIGKLLALREGMNLMYLLSNAEKMAEAQELAFLICSLLGVPELAVILKSFIIGIWSYEESVKDIQNLLKGEKVPILKRGDNNEEGIYYENYLELLLLIHNKEEKIYRAMDLVQINVGTNHSGFFLKDCIYELELNVKVIDYRKSEKVLTWKRNYY